MNEWISVNDRLPYHLQTIIALHKNGSIHVEEYRALAILNSFSRENFYGPVTHWVPIPEPPAKEGTI